MLKAIFTIFVIQSAILTVAGGWFWVRGYTCTDDIYIDTVGRMSRYRSSGGGFWFETRPRPANESKKFSWNEYGNHPYPFLASETDPWYNQMGFLFATGEYDLLLAAPYWSVIIPAFLLGLLVVRKQELWRLRQFSILHMLVLVTVVATATAGILYVARQEPLNRPWLILPLILIFFTTYLSLVLVIVPLGLCTAIRKTFSREVAFPTEESAGAT